MCILNYMQTTFFTLKIPEEISRRLMLFNTTFNHMSGLICICTFNGSTYLFVFADTAFILGTADYSNNINYKIVDIKDKTSCSINLLLASFVKCVK